MTTTTLSQTDRRELDHRSSNGIDVTLSWSPSRNDLVLTVHDGGDSFELAVAAASRRSRPQGTLRLCARAAVLLDRRLQAAPLFSTGPTPPAALVDSAVSSSPSGTVTFLLADVESSSGLQTTTASTTRSLSAGSGGILRQAVDANAGHEVDSVGDELLAAFSDAEPRGERRLRGPARDARRGLARVPARTHPDRAPHRDPVDRRRGLHGHRPRPFPTAPRATAGRSSPRRRPSPSSTPCRAAISGSSASSASRPRAHLPAARGRPRAGLPSLRNTSATVGKSIRVVIADDSVPSARVSRSSSPSPGSTWSRSRATPRTCSDTSGCTSPTSPSWTSGCRRRTRTRGSGRSHDPRALPGDGRPRALAVRRVRVRARPPVGERGGRRLPAQRPRLGRRAVRRVRPARGRGGSALDPAVVSQLIGRQRTDDLLDELTPREREVLELMAEGRSNQAIADRLFVTLRAVEKHVTEHLLEARPAREHGRPPARACRPAVPAPSGDRPQGTVTRWSCAAEPVSGH